MILLLRQIGEKPAAMTSSAKRIFWMRNRKARVAPGLHLPAHSGFNHTALIFDVKCLFFIPSGI